MWVDVIQNTDEWLNLRIGKITGSHFGTIMANYGKAFGDPAKNYAMQVALERATGRRVEDGFSNDWMQRGHELEQTARDLYELETFETVSNPGIFISGDYATSPDGLVGESGQIEIKSVKFNTHFDRLRKGGFDTKYQWQIQGNLMLSGREWLDFISYCPDFPQDKQLYVFRVYPDVNQIEMLKERLEQFNQLVKSNLELL